MKKYIKYSLLSIFTIIILIAVIINFTNINFTKVYISEAVNKILGRQLNLNGDLVLKLYPTPNLVVYDIQFQNAIWSESDYMLEADHISIKLSPQALFSGNIEITELIFDGFKINLERNDVKKFNWELDALINNESEKTQESKSKAKLPFDSKAKIILKNITVNYKVLKSEYEIIIKELSIDQDKETNIEIDALYRDIPINVNLSTALLNNILELDNIPLEVEGELGNIELQLKTAIPVKEIQEKQPGLIFDIKLNDLSTIKKFVALEAPEPGKIALKGELLKDNENITLLLDQVSVGKTQIDGKIQYINSGKIPDIVSQLNIRNLNLDFFEKFSKKEESVKNKKTKLFSMETLPFEYLKKYNADVDINIKGITHKVLELEELILQAKLKSGVLDVSKLYVINKRNEELNARIRINSKVAPPEVNLLLVTENIQLDKNDALKKYLSGANTNFKINIDSRGKSVQELMNHLNGQFIVKVGKGKLDDGLLKFISSNILTDLVNAINPIADKSDTTNLECAAVRFDIKDGVLTADKGIVMQTDKIQIISSGIINLKNETLEFGVRPQAREGVELNLNSLASMVKLSGKINDPDITMSIKDTAVVYSYFATGGVTFLAKSLYDTATRDKSPCETAILGPVEKH